MVPLYVGAPPDDKTVRLKAFVDKLEVLFSEGSVTPDEFIGCAAVVYKKYEDIANVTKIAAEIKRIMSFPDKQ
ncbi:hypothetical protein ACB458_002466 [Morganella morganii]|uniref:hypothetical protein n=1 Tax=Morganella morganii TaxID=582 RepID=UPI00066987E9|nr:hypothetical protein [Morganella morganii]ELW9227445.1 hypothetical protein [Morganella morganii]